MAYLFLGLKMDTTADKANQLVKKELMDSIVPENREDLANALSCEDAWKDPKDYHVTIYYGGNRPEEERQEHLDSFPEGKRVKTKLKYLVYTVGYNICSYVRILDPDVHSSNRFSHTTIKTRHSSAVNSNDVLEALYAKDKAVFEKPGTQTYYIYIAQDIKKVYVTRLEAEEILVNATATVYKTY